MIKDLLFCLVTDFGFQVGWFGFLFSWPYLILASFLFSEIGFYISSYCIMYPLHLLGHRSLSGNKSSQGKAIDTSWSWGSMEADIPHVVCVLYQHCFGKCELALYTSVLYADHKVLHSCNNRSVIVLCVVSCYYCCLFWSKHLMVSLSRFPCKSYFAVAGLEKVLWLENLGFSSAHCWRHSSYFSYRAKFQYVWFLCCVVWLSGHIYKDDSCRISFAWIQVWQVGLQDSFWILLFGLCHFEVFCQNWFPKWNLPFFSYLMYSCLIL